MSSRAYTVAEIDRLRATVKRQVGPNIPMGPLVGTCWSATPGERSVAISAGIAAREKIIEERLRTYMLAGIDPADLEAEAGSP